MADDGDEYEFDGDSSIKDLIARMGDIDKAIEDIHDLEKKRENVQVNGTPANGHEFSDTPGETAAEVEDVALVCEDEDDDDDCDAEAGLADMQKEMQLVEEQEHSFVEEIITVSCTKPTPESAIGISMKSSRGVTRIVGVNPEGLLADSKLRADLQLVSVNGMPVKNGKHAKYLIGIHPRDIVLVVKTTPPRRTS